MLNTRYIGGISTKMTVFAEARSAQESRTYSLTVVGSYGLVRSGVCEDVGCRHFDVLKSRWCSKRSALGTTGILNKFMKHSLSMRRSEPIFRLTCVLY